MRVVAHHVGAEASRVVLNDFEFGTDVKIVGYPDRYIDERGAVMWDRVMKLVDNQQAEPGGMRCRRRIETRMLLHRNAYTSGIPYVSS
jgi:hypothetical protein